MPILISLIWLNNHYIKKKGELKELTYNLLIVLNLLSFLPFPISYYYWDLVDYNSSGIFIIYILVFGVLLRFNSLRLVLLIVFFSSLYFGMIYYIGITYVETLLYILTE